MAKAAAQGAGGAALLMAAAQTGPVQILGSAGYLFICPENLAAMSGVMKDMFDRCFYPVLGQIEGRPFATIIAAGSDGEGAQRQIDRIALGWRLKRVAEPMIVNFAAQTPEAILAEKQVSTEVLDDCHNLGAALAEGLRLGVF